MVNRGGKNKIYGKSFNSSFSYPRLNTQGKGRDKKKHRDSPKFFVSKPFRPDVPRFPIRVAEGVDLDALRYGVDDLIMADINGDM